MTYIPKSDEERARDLILALKLPQVCCLLSDSAREWRGCDPNCKCPPSPQFNGVISFSAAIRAATLDECAAIARAEETANASINGTEAARRIKTKIAALKREGRQ